MAYKTVNLKPATYERLRMYQTGGNSLSDVVDLLMNCVEPEAIYREALRVHRRQVRALKKGGGMTVAQLRKALGRRR
ncbi:MAG: hypothetical protein HY557_04510 [Euryarchaeota archaeon]|nr:hypothetical protein [Euryarchaeota archaeon]